MTSSVEKIMSSGDCCVSEGGSVVEDNHTVTVIATAEHGALIREAKESAREQKETVVNSEDSSTEERERERERVRAREKGRERVRERELERERERERES